MQPARQVQTLLLVVLVLSAPGCGAGNEKPLVPVTGRLTFAGGDWPLPGTITLTPLASPGDTPARPGAANFQRDGKFIVGSYKPGDGLMPGKYAVSVSCFDPALLIPRDEAEFVPREFHAEDLEIKKGQAPVELNFDVPKKKGEKRA